MSIINIKHIIISLKIFRKILLDISNNNGKIILVGTLPKYSSMIKNLAQDLQQSYVNYKWIGGILTNVSVRNRVNSLDKFYKNHREQLRNRRDILSFRRYELLFKGLVNLDRSPDLIIIFNLKENISVIEEANKANIPILGFGCGNENLTGLTYKIPINIKNKSTLAFLCSFIKECLETRKNQTVLSLKNQNILFESFI